MSNIKINGLITVAGMTFHDIEGGFGEGKKAMLVKEIAEIHSKEVKYINKQINSNIKRFVDGVDIIDLKTSSFGEPVLDVAFTKAEIGNANNIYLLSERGYSKLLKILEDDVAWEQYEKLVDGYFNARATLSNLSPQLQLLINIEMEQKRQSQELSAVNQKLDGIKDVVALNTQSWREDARKLIIRIAQAMGGNEYIQNVNADIYKLVEQRGGFNLQVRLTNKRRRMADEGVCKSTRDKLNKMDIIADDKRLIEIYVAIVKEMAIKYGVDLVA